MKPITWMTVAEYAAHRGCSDSYVRRMRRESRLVIATDGRIDRDASDARLAAEQDPLRGGVRTRPDPDEAAELALREAHAGAGQAAGGAPLVGTVRIDTISLKEAMRRERLAKARSAELELGEATKQLTRTRDVERAVFTLARRALERLRGMKTRLRTELAAESDPRAIEAILDNEIREICTDMQAATRALFEAPAAETEGA